MNPIYMSFCYVSLQKKNNQKDYVFKKFCHVYRKKQFTLFYNEFVIALVNC